MDVNKINTIEELENYRKSINEACDKRKEYLTLSNKAQNLSKKSFPYLKESCEAFAASLFETKEGRDILAKYTRSIKNDANLSKMHNLCETVRKANKDCDVDFLINHITSSNWNLNKKELKESTSKLGKVLAEAYMQIGKKSDTLLPKENTKFSSSIQYIAENTKNNKNIVEYSNAIKVIRDRIMENTDGVDMPNECGNLDAIIDEMVDDFNNKYTGELSEEEISAIKEISESKNSEDIFNKYKDSCIGKIEEAKNKAMAEGDNDTYNKISTIQEQVSKKEFSHETITNDICNLIELSNIFE